MMLLTRIVIGVLAVLVVLILLFQESLIFFPQPISGYNARNIVPQFEEYEFTHTNESLSLEGWLIPSDSKTLLIYFGGNAEEVSSNLPDFTQNIDCNILLMNYRGYGNSEGKPSEIALFADAEILYDAAVQRLGPDKIVLMGRSLGTGVATYLAQSRRCDSLILVTPFDSMQSMASSALPFLPTSLLLRHKFRSDLYVSELEIPVQILVAEYDEIVSREHSNALISCFPTAPKTEVIPRTGHNNIQSSPAYWQTMQAFLELQK